MLKTILLSLVIAFFLTASKAEATEPTCPYNASSPAFTSGGSVFGRIAAQWNAYFAAKADVNNGVLCNPTIIGGTLPGFFNIGPGLTAILGTFNIGNQLIANGATLNKQLFPTTKSTSYVVNTDNGEISDSGKMLIATAAITFTLPNPGEGTKGVSYNFGSDGAHSFTLNTSGMTALLYGCVGAGVTSYTFDVGTQVAVVDDGANYNCTATSSVGSSANRLLYVPNNAALKALPAGGFTLVHKGGFATPGDSTPADYYWDGSSSLTDDGCSAVQPTSGTGRWLIAPATDLDIRCFGTGS